MSLFGTNTKKMKLAFFEGTPDAVLVFAAGNFVDCNAAAVTMFGYPDKKALTSVSPAQLSPAKQPDGQSSATKSEAMIKEALVKGSNRFEWIHSRADGSDLPVLVTLTATKVGGKPILFTSLADLTTAWREREQRREEAAGRAKSAKLQELTADFDRTVSTALGAVGQVAGMLESSSQAMSGAAEQTNRQLTDLAAASEQVSAAVGTVSHAAGELSASIAEIGRQVHQSSTISSVANEEARHTNDIVRGLAESSAKIGEVINLINGIAAQTNLLALNATIEAARAGEAGRGFAVVAQEVKALANQTTKATEEIGAQIGAVQSATGQAVTAIGGIATRINEINEIAGAIAAAVEEQSRATAGIAANIEQASTASRKVAANTSGVSQAAIETRKTAEEVLSSAKALTGEAGGLRGTVDSFLQGVRRA
jgi:methyl-accepting chemotaxis protein